MSFSRVGLGIFKGIGGGITGLIGATFITFVARYINYLSPISIKKIAYILALGNFLYGLVVSDANGENRIRKVVGIDNLVAKANNTWAMSIKYNINNGHIEKALDSIREGEKREKFFIQNFLYSIFENATAGTIGFGVLMLLNSSNISYLQLMESVVAGAFITSSVKSMR